MKVEIQFIGNGGHKSTIFDMRIIPRIGECISIDGDDAWRVQDVIHFITPIYINDRACVVAQVRVG